jgi:hypothetical protein
MIYPNRNVYTSKRPCSCHTNSFAHLACGCYIVRIRIYVLTSVGCNLNGNTTHRSLGNITHWSGTLDKCCLLLHVRSEDIKHAYVDIAYAIKLCSLLLICD